MDRAAGPDCVVVVLGRHHGGAANSTYWLGTDDNGRDVLSQVILGTRISMLVGFSAALVSAVIGGTFGILSGYFGGFTDRVLTILDDWFLVIPFLPLAIVLVALLDPNAFPEAVTQS